MPLGVLATALVTSGNMAGPYTHISLMLGLLWLSFAHFEKISGDQWWLFAHRLIGEFQ